MSRKSVFFKYLNNRNLQKSRHFNEIVKYHNNDFSNLPGPIRSTDKNKVCRRKSTISTCSLICNKNKIDMRIM